MLAPEMSSLAMRTEIDVWHCVKLYIEPYYLSVPLPIAFNYYFLPLKLDDRSEHRVQAECVFLVFGTAYGINNQMR